MASEYCKVCFVVPTGVKGAKNLRKLRYCNEHLPSKYRCQATTIKGKPCVNVITRGEYCHVHRKKKATRKVSTVVNRRKLGYIDYNKYIQSRTWKSKADEAKRLSGYRCRLCNISSEYSILHVHHRTYDRLGDESQEDLTVLCDSCHSIFHDRGKVYKSR